MIKSNKNWSGLIINNVLLGDPAKLDDETYIWDDILLPNGIIDDDGNFIIENNE